VTTNFNSWMHGPKTGSISLEHDLLKNEASQAPSAMDIVVKNGYAVKTISQCLQRNSTFTGSSLIALKQNGGIAQPFGICY
jgi:hypothetical protein